MRSPWQPFLRRCALGVAALAILSLSTSDLAQAELITFKFAGVLDSFSSTPLAQSLPSNTPVTGSYSFESTAPDELAHDPYYGQYALHSFSLDLLGTHYRMSPTSAGSILIHSFHTGNVDLGNGFNSAYFVGVYSLVSDEVTPYGPISFNSSITYHSRADSLLLLPPGLGGGSYSRFAMNFRDTTTSEDYVLGQLTSLTLAPVPLPGALLLFGSSLLGLAGLGLRRQVARVERHTETDPIRGH